MPLSELGATTAAKRAGGGGGVVEEEMVLRTRVCVNEKVLIWFQCPGMNIYHLILVFMRCGLGNRSSLNFPLGYCGLVAWS